MDTIDGFVPGTSIVFPAAHDGPSAAPHGRRSTFSFTNRRSRAVALGPRSSLSDRVASSFTPGGYAAASYLEFPVTFAPEWFGVAVAVGIGVGIVSGIYPAWDAARTDPIDALRHE